MPPESTIRPNNRRELARDNDDTINPTALLEIDDRVGGEIRDLRKAKDMTIAELSQETSLSQGYISQIERGVSRPSIKALHSISRALGVTISWFFPPTSDDDDNLRDIVVRSQKRRRLRFSSGITDELLSPSLGNQLELLRCVFNPGAESGPTPYTHRGEEAGIIISGELQLWVGAKHVVLHEGDSFAFKSNLPHRYANKSDGDTIVIWSITPPSY